MDKNPFGWLPRPGQSAKVPGGFIVCESWMINHEGDNSHFTGEVVFKFFVSPEHAKDWQPSAPEPIAEVKAIEGGKVLDV